MDSKICTLTLQSHNYSAYFLAIISVGGGSTYSSITLIHHSNINFTDINQREGGRALG